MSRFGYLALAALACSPGYAGPSTPVILVSVDTLRADHLSCYQAGRRPTPHIDGLAKNGTLFSQVSSPFPLTLPAHAALLTSTYPFSNGVEDNGIPLQSTAITLATVLKNAGYRTGAFVGSFVLDRRFGLNRGFDVYDGPLDVHNKTTSGAVERKRPGARVAEAATRWVERNSSAPFFLFLHLYEPHKPYAPPERFGAYDPYDGEIAYSDEIVGRLVRYLKSHQLYDRSTVILLSDHGEGLGDHGEQEHGLFVYEEAIHVPLIIKQESNAGAGRRVTDLVQHIDVVPTILDLVKAPGSSLLRGRSLKPVLEGTGHLPEPKVYSEALYARYHFGWSELTALTDDRYRYIKAPREELYDLQLDTRERTNIAGERPQARQALRGALDRVAAGATIPAPSQISADARERLQALGYVGTHTDVPATSGEALPDPKDKREILERYRAAVDYAGQRKWPQAIVLLQQILRDNPGMADVWSQLAVFASRLDRHEQAVDAYMHYIELKPADPTAYLGVAGGLLKLRKLDEARVHAQLAADVAPESDHRARASAHEMLAKIALAKHDADAAREEAQLARDENPTLPLYVEARLLYDQGKYTDALPLFRQAIAGLKRPGPVQISDLHFYTADTLGRLERYPEAEAEFIEELRLFPQNTRARGGLAMLYQASGQPDAATRVLADMTRVTPTPESYALAARIYTMFGNRRQADAIRAQGRRTQLGIKN